MALNEKIRTEDVVEVLDSKILTLSQHPSIGVIARENYDSVMTKIAAQTLSSAEKAAFDSAGLAGGVPPSSSNPVVLKDDLSTYIPAADLGEVKDSVPTYSDLTSLYTAPINTYGDLRAVIDGGIIYRWTGTTFTLDPSDVNITTSTITHTAHGMANGQQVTLSSTGNLPSDLHSNVLYYVVNKTLNDFQLSLMPSGSAIALTSQGTGTLRLMYDGYWDAFIHSGTLDHTQLQNQNGDSLYQHVTQAEKTLLLTQTHAHINKPVLDLITDAGSGQIVTTNERARIPTTDQKAALAGTSGAPSSVNPYVTNNDPRLNTVRNPYVTIGPPGTLASFQGIDFRPFSDALVAIDIGSASAVKAIEVLPGFYTFGGVYLQWNTQTAAIVIEAWTPASATLSFRSFQAGIQALDYPFTGKLPLIIRGFTFEINDTATAGILTQRANTLIEDCSFKPGPTTGGNQTGITLQGDNSIVRRCKFDGSLTTGISVRAAGCRVEECAFTLTSPSAAAISLPNEFQFSPSNVVSDAIQRNSHGLSNGLPVTFYSTGMLPSNLVAGVTYFVVSAVTNSFKVSNVSGGLPITLDAGSGLHYVARGSHSFIDHCTFQSGQLSVGFANAYNGIYNNFISPAASIADSGFSTRFIENMPQEINQPYVGGTRTVGPIGTYADYRGSTETPILAALADPRCTEVLLLDNTYTIGSTISIPAGKSIRAAKAGVVQLTATSGVTAFFMNSDTGLGGLSITGSYAPLVTVVSSRAHVDGCWFNLTAGGSGDCEVLGSNVVDFTVERCQFDGVRGISLLVSTRSYIKDNVFSNTYPLVMASCTLDHISGNVFGGLNSPDIRGSNQIITSNHFTIVPTKVNTSTSVWSGNFPHPYANNDDGVDWLTVSLDSRLEPIAVSSRTELNGAGVISLPDGITSSAGCLPVSLVSALDSDRSYTIDAWWTSPAAGSVKWEFAVTFLDRISGQIGNTTTVSTVSLRTTADTQVETQVSIPVTTGFNLGVLSPTHVSVLVRRLGSDTADTLTSVVYLLDVQLTLPRN